MKNTLKAIGIVFIGLLIWIVIIYTSIAFVKNEANPFMWKEALRFAMVFIACGYLAFTPLLINIIKDEL